MNALHASATASRARDLYEHSVVWDAHAGFMPEAAADLEGLSSWREAGVTHLSLNVGFDLLPPASVLASLDTCRQWIADHAECFVLVSTAEEIRQAKVEDKLALTFDIEGMNALDGRVEMIERFHRLGVRQMLFAYNLNNLAGGGCHDADHGLTEFGRAVLAEMNRVGIVADLSHCGYRTSMDVMSQTTRPVTFSHSNPRALCNHERNITNEQIRACAATGGVVGIAGLSLLLAGESPAVLAKHVCHVLDLIGPRHVGIGLDYAHGSHAPRLDEIVRTHPQFWPADRGYANFDTCSLPPAALVQVAEILLQGGHSDETVRGVLGGNFLRLAEEVWR